MAWCSSVLCAEIQSQNRATASGHGDPPHILTCHLCVSLWASQFTVGVWVFFLGLDPQHATAFLLVSRLKPKRGLALKNHQNIGTPQPKESHPPFLAPPSLAGLAGPLPEEGHGVGLVGLLHVEGHLPQLLRTHCARRGRGGWWGVGSLVGWGGMGGMGGVGWGGVGGVWFSSGAG